MHKSTLVILGAFGAIIAAAGLAISKAKPQEVTSGVKVGGILGSFRPRHATGADRGANVCPMCQYPNDPAVQVWVNGDDENNVAAIAGFLEKSLVTHKARKLKAFLVFYNYGDNTEVQLRRHLEVMASRNHLTRTALTFLPSSDSNAFRDNEIAVDPAVKNTVFVYKASKVTAKFVNLTANPRGLGALDTAVTALLK